jgi:hypothetical protein
MEIKASIIEENIYSGKIGLLAQGHKLISQQALSKLILTASTSDIREPRNTDYQPRSINS